MTNLMWAIFASISVSLISFVGFLTLVLNNKLLAEILILLVGFAAGSMIGAAFLQILPESLEHYQYNQMVFIYVLAGFSIFFFLEKYLYWRHCHERECKIHPFAYLNLLGDGIHNFSDGLIIGTSFTISINLGIVTTLAIIFHEIPQEFGDFAVLLYSGLTKIRVALYNFISGLLAVFGAIVGYYLSSYVNDISKIILPIAAGGFIYIASCDLIPELHKQTNTKRAVTSMLAFIVGILIIYFLGTFLHH